MSTPSKSYFLGITMLALIGIIYSFENYPIIIGLCSFVIGAGYKEYSPDYKDKDKDNDLLDQN